MAASGLHGRPTFHTAIGGDHEGNNSAANVPTQMVRAKSQNMQMDLKKRRPGQGTIDDIAQRDLKAELEAREAEHFAKKNLGHQGQIEGGATLGKEAIEGGTEGSKDENTDIGATLGEAPVRKRPLLAAVDNPALDADDSDDGSASTDSEDSSDDEDDTAELMRELERIKKERAEEAARKERETLAVEVETNADAMLNGNPLLNGDGGSEGFAVKRRWDDDVVFKNQSRTEPKQKKRFINDTLRNDAHRKFMHKYIQ
eukprot:TRINITY_DN32679_c0_g1_i1.p1 TRINITY_DN32679_c0_g1~~TRINITY_DN32679_c0_g1_i1.p1  ORF type:complete len:257 (+),score=68.98 TRINITY_DN32679_c0_g1_i1:70-840(+)